MRWVLWIFTALYVIALLLLLIGTLGLFGQEEDPLSAVFLLPLGLPWNVLADKIGIPGTIATIAAPALNAAILYWLWKRRS